MAEIQPFRAFRYDLGRVGALADVVAPPYDVIGPAEQEKLYTQSDYNVIRLILNKQSGADTENDNRYTRASNTLKSWLADDVLVQDSARSLYAYHQEFEVEGRTYTRKGFLARVRLEPFGEGKIYPHEHTMAGPKADRLKLFHATNMNLSPIFGLFPDPDGQTNATLDKAIGQSLPLQATDSLGVSNKLWPVSDQHAISTVSGLLSNQPIFIADGHHRYETSLKYREEAAAAGELADDAPPNFTMMMLVSMSDPGLIVLPTHRLVSGLPNLDSAKLNEVLGSHFDLEKVGDGPQAANDTWEMIEADGSQAVLGFGTVADGVWHLARLKDAAAMEPLAPQQSPAWRGLAVSVLHVLVLDHLLKEKLGASPECRYVHQTSEVIESVGSRECQLAALVPPATMKHVEEIAGNLEKMPPKSTYFFPKLLSGLVFNSLKQH